MRSTLRLSVLSALLLTTSTGVVMASSTACRVAVVEQLRYAQRTVRKHMHHSAATLARWKIGAAAWSKAHGGKVYAGVPTLRRSDWKPLTFNCDDVIALDGSRPDEGLLLTAEDVPEFGGYEDRAPGSVRLDLASTTIPPVEQTWEQAAATPIFRPAPLGGFPVNGAGNGVDGSTGAASFPPAPVPAPLVAPVPTPEPPTVTLLATGLASFLVTRLRRRTVV